MKNLTYFLLTFIVFLSSCKKEEQENIEPADEKGQPLLEFTDLKLYSSTSANFSGYDFSSNCGLTIDDQWTNIHSNGISFLTFGVSNDAKIKRITLEEYNTADSKSISSICDGTATSSEDFLLVPSGVTTPTYCINDGDHNYLIQFTEVLNESGFIDDHTKFNYKAVDGTTTGGEADPFVTENIKGTWLYTVPEPGGFFITEYYLEIGDITYTSSSRICEADFASCGSREGIQEYTYTLKEDRILLDFVDARKGAFIEYLSHFEADSLVIRNSFYSKVE